MPFILLVLKQAQKNYKHPKIKNISRDSSSKNDKDISAETYI